MDAYTLFELDTGRITYVGEGGTPVPDPGQGWVPGVFPGRTHWIGPEGPAERPAPIEPLRYGARFDFAAFPADTVLRVTNEAGETETWTVGEEPELLLVDPGRYVVAAEPPFPHHAWRAEVTL